MQCVCVGVCVGGGGGGGGGSRNNCPIGTNQIV